MIGARGAPREGPLGTPEPADREPTPSRWRWLVLGLTAAWLAQFILPCSFPWVLCALPHEMGHATIGCLLGHPSAPAISLRGEAWTGIAEQQPWLAWAIAAGFAGSAIAQRQRLALAIALGLAAVLTPLLAFGRAAPIAIALGGHLGELAFATFCFAITWTGGRSDTPAERIAGAMAGGLIQAANITLAAGLLTSAAARETYRSNGSLGMKNDYLVLAEDLLHCPLSAIALPMLLLALLPLPLGLACGWLRDRQA